MKRWLGWMVVCAGVAAGVSGASAVEVLKAMGRNSEGQLGTGILPSRVIASGVADVSSGSFYTLILRDNGEMWGVGYSFYGELGPGMTGQSIKVPMLLESGVARMSAGEGQSLFVKADGSLWGSVPETNGRKPFVRVADNVAKVDSGSSHAVWVDTAGVMWGKGSNYYGELGAGYSNVTYHQNPIRVVDGVREVAAGEYNTFYIANDGSLWVMGNMYGFGRRKVTDGVVAVSAGASHGIFVKTDGSLWGMGRNLEGQLGDGTVTNRSEPVRIAEGVVAVEASYSNSFFIKADGTLWGMGGNTVGSAGTGTNNPVNVPVKIAHGVRSVSGSSYSTLFVKTDGSLWAMGGDDYGQLGDTAARGSSVPLPVALGVGRISAGIYSSGFSKDGNWWTSGFEGIVGQSSGLPVQAATDVEATAGDFRHRLILKKNKTLWAQGENQYGKLGDGTTTNRPQPVSIATGVSRIGVGQNYSVFVKENGDLHGMGYLIWATNVQPQPWKLATGVAEVYPGPGHVLYLTTAGTLFGFGDNTYGQLGTGFGSGPYPIQSSSNAGKAATGRHHSLILEKDGSLWVTGRNQRGQLGDGLGADRMVSHKLIPSGVVDIAAGENHSLFLKSDGTLWGMGANDRGQLGIGNSADQPVPVKIADRVTSIAAGATHSLFTQTRNSAEMYQDWAALRWLSGEAALPATATGNGTANLLQYAFNVALHETPATMPAAGGKSGLPRVGLAQGAAGASPVFRFEYVRRKDSGLVYTPQWSPDLQPDSFVPLTGTPQVTSIDSWWERVVIEEPCDPAAKPKMFGRVDVALPE